VVSANFLLLDRFIARGAEMVQVEGDFCTISSKSAPD
jgi:hypothetical protein